MGRLLFVFTIGLGVSAIGCTYDFSVFGEGGSGGTSSSTSSASASVSTVGSNSTTGPGGGGAGGDDCGNGVIDVGEQCDDGLENDDRLCERCEVVCGEVPDGDGYAQFFDASSNHCYVVFKANKTLPEAEAYCFTGWKANSYLASIENSQEQALVQPHLVADGYLGGDDLDLDDTWRWSNGDVFTYTNWEVPNEPGMKHHCLVMQEGDGLWDAHDDCQKQGRHFVCEWEPKKSAN
jgi:hypothetical protein